MMSFVIVDRQKTLCSLAFVCAFDLWLQNNTY